MVFYLIDEGAGEMTLLEGGEVTICEREGKSGVHGGDENHNPGRLRGKWRSWRG